MVVPFQCCYSYFLPWFFPYLPDHLVIHNTSLVEQNANESSLCMSIWTLCACPWSGWEIKILTWPMWWPAPIARQSYRYSRLNTHVQTRTHKTQETGRTNDVFCTSCIISAMSVSTIHKDLLPFSPHTHRSEIAQCCLNNHFSVQLNSCWRSSLLSLLSENSPLPLFNPLRGSREREREGEREQHWMLTGT